MELTRILAAVCVIAGILLLRPIVNVLPSLAGCLLRWKECLNMEDSMKLCRDRNVFAAFMTVPFLLVAAEYRLYNPDFLAGIDMPAYLGCICGVFLCYILIRLLAGVSVRKPKAGEKTFAAARKTSYSFFCIMAAAVLTAAGICSFSDISTEVTRHVLLYVLLVSYIIFIFRKFQIFRNCCSFLSSILYLCALEILPAAILIVPAVFL